MRVPNLTFVYDRKKQASKSVAGVVELKISLGKIRKYMSTGVKVLPREWSNGSIVGREDWKELNDMLQVIKKRCSEIIIDMLEDGHLDLGAVPGLLKDSMIQKQTFIGYAKEMAERRYLSIRDVTKAHYVLFFKFMDEWKGIVYFADLTEKNILKMNNELIRRGLQVATRWNYHKVLRTFLKQAIEDGLVKKDPYRNLKFKRSSETGIKRFLYPEEFHRFENCVIPIERFRRVRDLFVFQTYTCMSYCDLVGFDLAACVEINGNKVYRSKRQKTGQEFTFMLVPTAMEILNRYGGKLPIISCDKYNDYLKTAVMYAKIDKPVSTHWARHTGATLYLNEGGMPMHIVQHILGHSTIRETERTYAKVLDSSVVDSMRKLSNG